MKGEQSYKSNRYDIAFINPDIDNVLAAIEQVQKGEKVQLFFENDLLRTDIFQLTQIFPYRAIHLFRSAQQKQNLNKLFLLAPHLFQLQKVFYLQSKPSKKYANIVDLFLRNQLNEKSVIVNQPLPGNLSFFKMEALKGLVIHEYKVNVSRLFVELLKYFELKGGKVLMNEKFPHNEISKIIRCKNEKRSSYLLTTETVPGFALIQKSGKIRIQFFEQNGHLQIDFLGASTSQFTKNSSTNELKKHIHFNTDLLEEVEWQHFISAKTISKFLEIVKEPLPNSFANSQISDNYELSLEKFDIAKQTGISYPQFKILFHRYGAGIDEMIDVAYEKTSLLRNAEEIWEKTEEWYQKKYEWRK